MYLAEIWRYPVKSMAGEQLESAWVDRRGVEGDRLIHVVGHGRRGRPGASERLLTARTEPGLLGHRAIRTAAGEILVDGHHWQDPEVALAVEQAAGPGAHLVLPSDAEPRHDILPLLVATDGVIASLGLDRRRFRPNLLIGGVDCLAERGWEHRRLRVGEVVIQLADLRGRCVMTTFDPDTLEQDPAVLRTIVDQLDGVLGLNAEVLREGTVRRGDLVELL